MWRGDLHLAGDDTQRLTIDLQQGGLPCGSVTSASGQSYCFTGWMELAAAIEQAREGPQRPEAQRLRGG
jgi:hypothetical protein